MPTRYPFWSNSSESIEVITFPKRDGLSIASYLGAMFRTAWTACLPKNESWYGT